MGGGGRHYRSGRGSRTAADTRPVRARAGRPVG